MNTVLKPAFKKALLVEALAAAVLLSACGGGDSSGSSAQHAAADAESQPTLSGEPTDNSPTNVLQADAATSESAQASCAANAYDGPLVAAYDMTRDRSAARQALLAKYDLAVVNMTYTLSDETVNAFTGGIKKLNAATRIAQFIGFPDLKSDAGSTEYDNALAKEVSARGWWLKAPKSQVSWTDGSSYAVNMTAWTKTSNGQNFPQFKASFDHKAYLKDRSGVDYLLTANVFDAPRIDADWRGTGKNQSRSDATVQAATRAGYASYWDAVRKLAPGVKLIGAPDKNSSLSTAEFRGKLDGAFLDGLMGQSWSIYERSGWSAMMNYYRTVVGNTKGDKAVVFSVYGETPTDYATMRFGLASALMADGLYAYRSKSGSSAPAWYDEFDAPLGKAIDPVQTVAASNGIFRRRFENGVVLVNPTDASAKITIGSGYRRLSGTQDRTVNNGKSESTVTLPARSGLVMIKDPVPCVVTPPAPAPAPAPAPTPAPSPAPDPVPAGPAPAPEPVPTTPPPPPPPPPPPAPAPEPAPAPAPSTGFAKPRIAALDYSRNVTNERMSMLAKFDYVILSLQKNQGAAVMKSFTSGIKRLNPSIKMGHYVLPTEVLCEVPSNHDHYDTWVNTNKADWWLYKADGSRSQWTTVYKACDINMTRWAKKNEKGQTWAQWKWERDYGVWFKNMPDVEYVHFDNTFRGPRVDADWRRNGTNQSRNDAATATAFREGTVDQWNAVLATNPNYKISTNTDGDLSQPEYKGKVDFAFLEGVIGKSWSKEKDWNAAMKYYRDTLKNVKTSGNVILQAFTPSTDYALARYGLAMAMLDDGYYMQTDYPSARQQPSWYDEYDAPIGKAIEAPPTKAASGSIWMRKYENGLVLVNSSKTASATITVGAGYKRLSGKQDPAVNNGRAESTVTLPPRSGLLMLRTGS